MENITILGVVTLFNPDENIINKNINSYIPYISELIIWDNSEKNHNEWFEHNKKTIYHSTGRNTCIAPAINYAAKYMLTKNYSMLLIMDQDSKWENFNSFAEEAKKLNIKKVADVFTPFVKGCDRFEITSSIMPRRLFINSGTLMSAKAVEIIGKVDEKAFPLDALDHDMALTLLENNIKVVCLTDYLLTHHLGNIKQMGLFNIMTHDYNAFRTYSMTRSHIICHRKHYKTMNKQERRYVYKEIIFQKLKRILLAEKEKRIRFKALIKGIIDGLKY